METETQPQERQVSPRRRRRWPWVAGATAVVVAGSVAAGIALSAPGRPPLSAACKQAVATQNDFVDKEVAAGYPDGMSISDAFTVMIADEKLLTDVGKAGCPGDTKVHVLP